MSARSARSLPPLDIGPIGEKPNTNNTPPTAHCTIPLYSVLFSVLMHIFPGPRIIRNPAIWSSA
eukprot:4557324-Alexandrium_andersonii.AAC.1